MINLIGKTVRQAAKVLKSNGKELRVTERDGKPFMFTMDYAENRINVSVIKGRIVNVVGIG